MSQSNKVLLLDSDIIQKTAAFGILQGFLEVAEGLGSFQTLSLIKLVARKRIERSVKRGEPQSTLDHFNKDENNILSIEPTSAELTAAAKLEEMASQLNLSLDSGESQLTAVLVARGLSRLVTGDKRAIVAAASLVDKSIELSPINGKLACFEQVLGLLIENLPFESISKCVCERQEIDRSASIIFSCKSGNGTKAGALDALSSYIADLRTKSADVLQNGEVLN